MSLCFGSHIVVVEYGWHGPSEAGYITSPRLEPVKTLRLGNTVSAMFNDFTSWAGGKLMGGEPAKPQLSAEGNAHAAAELQSEAETGKKREASLSDEHALLAAAAHRVMDARVHEHVGVACTCQSGHVACLPMKLLLTWAACFASDVVTAHRTATHTRRARARPT